MYSPRVCFVILVVLCGVGCQPPADDDTTASPSPSPTSSEAAWVWDLPPGFPEPYVPENNPMNRAKVEVGRHLFFDVRLSGNKTQACGSCHLPELAFSDGKQTPTGSTGTVLSRNAMALADVGWNSTYTWPNPVLQTLEDQALVPMFGEFPVELGMSGKEEEILDRLRQDNFYAEQFPSAFPGEDDPITVSNVVKAISAFERTLISANSPYDQFAYGGDSDALSDSAKRGLSLFFSEKAECYHCHVGPTFSTAFRAANSTTVELQFFNTGLYNIGGTGAYPPGNEGLKEFTGLQEDTGRFRVPGLRNLDYTAPYMHDGSVTTLEEVIEHYNEGGRTITDGPYAGVGADNPYKNPLVKPMNLTEQEKADLLAFLRSLNDSSFVTNPDFADPFSQ